MTPLIYFVNGPVIRRGLIASEPLKVRLLNGTVFFHRSHRSHSKVAIIFLLGENAGLSL
jgi:hypothetical protein